MLQRSYLSTKKLLYSLFALIFFQNAFVFSVAGGTLKWYELASILLLFYLMFCVKRMIVDKVFILLLLLFVVSPIISDICSFVIKPFDEDVYQLYYFRFPEAKTSLRCNFIFSTIYSLMLSLGVFAILYFVINSDYLYRYHQKVTKFFIYTGTVVAFYSLYQFFGITFLGLPDFVPAFLDGRNFRGAIGNHRAGGFSIEPGSYVFIQSIVVLYLIVGKNYFSNRKRKKLLVINIIALLLTLSSSMVVFFGIFGFYIIFFSKNRIARVLCIFFIISLIIIFPVLNEATNNLLQYIFITKLQNFISSPNNTLDSGAMRAFTNGIGYKIFKSYPLFGCGFGNSFFYMPLYEHDMGIQIWGERLNASSIPQNNFSKILAEQGLFGIIPFILLFMYSIRKFYKYRKDNICLTYLIITLLLLGYNFTVGVYLTNLFIWLNLALGLNYMKHRYLV